MASFVGLAFANIHGYKLWLVHQLWQHVFRHSMTYRNDIHSASYATLMLALTRAFARQSDPKISKLQYRRILAVYPNHFIASSYTGRHRTSYPGPSQFPCTSSWDSPAANIAPRVYLGKYTPSDFTILTVLIPVY